MNLYPLVPTRNELSLSEARLRRTPAAIVALVVTSFVACSASQTPSPAEPPPSLATQETPAPAGQQTPESSASTPTEPATPETPAPAQAVQAPQENAPCPPGMALVPGGSFQKPRTKGETKVESLCVDITETTAAEYADCVEAGKCTTTHLDCAAQATYGKPERANHPIVCVDFSQAEAYCTFRNKRLPHTDEWEWAARAGNEGRTYPWGDDKPSDQLCWTGTEKKTESCAVGSFPKGDSPHGLKDLAGNVLEFTTTDLDAKGKIRIARGGSWRDGAPELVRVARVGGFELSYRCGFLGIRCVVPVKGSE